MTTEQHIELRYKPLPGKAAVHTCRANNILLLGGYGDGKTSCGVNDIIDLAMKYPGSRWLLARFTYREIEDTVKHTVREWLPSELYRERRADEMFNLTCGSQLIFRSLDSPDKYGGLEISGFLIDEAKEVPERVYEALLGRRRQQGVPEWARRGILCSNPPTKRHWLYRWFGPERHDKEDFAVFQGTTYENAENLPPGYIATMEAAYKHRITLYKRYMLGEWGADVSGEPVHPGFSEALHVDAVREDEPFKWSPAQPLIRGWDFGGGASAGCCVWQFDNRGRVRILAEFNGANITTDKFGAIVKARCSQMFRSSTHEAVYDDWGDPTGLYRSGPEGKSHFLIMRQRNNILIKAPPLSNREERAEAVDIWLNQLTDGVPNVTIPSETATPVLFGGFLGEYAYKKDRLGRIGEKIETNVDCIHIMDAFQYSFIGKLGVTPWAKLGRHSEGKLPESMSEDKLPPLKFNHILGGSR